jgi:hypothetical protein
MDTIARRILDVEVMEGEELRRILGLPPAPASEPATTSEAGVNPEQ